ncbi:MAG: helicase HerA domain-containing protein [Candidatus Hodarchaeales archaeon]
MTIQNLIFDDENDLPGNFDIKEVHTIVAIGRVVATPTTPNLEKIDFILNPSEENPIERGQFVSILESNEKTVIGIITSIKKYNAYFETQQASVQENVSRDFDSIFPIKEWEVVLVELKPLGEFDPSKEKINRIKYPVSPGAKACLASPSIISRLLGLNDKGLFLGNIPQNNVEVRLDTSRLLRKHLAILAISGAGKSYATSVLLEELHKQGNTSVLLVDPHGEYGPLISSWENSASTEVVNGSYLSICVPELSAWEISEFIPEISPVQTRILEKTLAEIRKEKQLYGLNDIIKWLDSSENINSRTKEALIGWLHSLTKTYLFSSKNDINFEKMMEPGKVVVLDLADITSIRSRRMLTLYFLKNLYRLRTNNKIPPIVFVIEEAHQFCPQNSSSISKWIIETIAREGRKFYASLCLISQRPVNLSVTALSQCNTNIILRIRNPYDLDFIGRTSESIDRSALNFLPSLNIGEALLVGEAINFPTFFQIRKRKLSITEVNPDFEAMAKKYAKAWISKGNRKNGI